ncbi:hypothetical protein M409DRAFT_66216 [Zasmidium cellare ATCC 36951]|uniref:CSN8/PSMD8/EIF3K domain-containing protein n=1 Tax=Zasmidium cellare ATCC 36951 TaxID=1080233 RepID=A0A6A6CLZ4_ZASCE|nr:uncharacterized protein M409DRAFT_66216 [Zasmidium cellare ATCC 36951]KAF2167180.1 hypothetical protein M409DRAFT_66216 [Zasmidium cellare ATCC 36951]
MSTSVRPQPRRGASGAWNRLKPGPSDPLDAYTLPSKGETRLHDFKTQESYHQKIVERYMKFCASSGGPDNGLEEAFNSLSVKDSTTTPFMLPSDSSTSTTRPPLTTRTSTTPRPNDLPNILLAMRKLREGISASRRTDHFAQRAYIFIIHATILCRAWEAYQPALHYLLHKIHPVTPLSAPEVQEFAGYRVLDLACRQYEMTDAMRVRLEFQLRDRRLGVVLHSLVHDDWVRFWRAKRAVDGYQRALLEFASERMRVHALKCLGRSYLSVEKGFVERSGDAEWKELVEKGVGWMLREDGVVVIRKPKAKT